MRRLLPLLLLLAALVGCGNERTPVPESERAVAPGGERRYTLQGVRFTAPANWAALEPDGRLVGGIRSNAATLAIWRYRRTESLPGDRAALRAAARRLVVSVKERDPSFRLRRLRLRPSSVELRGSQTMAGVRVEVRSRHVFKDGAEVVVDAYAPPAQFDTADRAVFRPVLRTLRVG